MRYTMDPAPTIAVRSVMRVMLVRIRLCSPRIPDPNRCETNMASTRLSRDVTMRVKNVLTMLRSMGKNRFVNGAKLTGDCIYAKMLVGIIFKCGRIEIL